MAAGLIFGVVALVWLVFLVPWFAGRNIGDEADSSDLAESFTRSTTLIQRSRFSQDEVTYEVSTPLTRRAERREVHQVARAAAHRRRNVMALLVLASIGAGVAAPFTPVTWWQALVPVVLLAAFCVLARISVRSLNARLDARLAALDEAEDEPTIAFEVPESLRSGGLFGGPESTEVSIELSAPIGRMGGLWEPIPVTAPTYLAKPLVPRTVRTIDLSAPEPTVSVPVGPVVAEPLPVDEPDKGADEQRPRAVGE